MMLAKSNKNDISFKDIQKSYSRIKKQISLPPIKQNLNSSTTDDNLQSKVKNFIQQIQKNKEDHNKTFDHTSPAINKTFDSSNNIKTVKRSNVEVLDLIHKMRIQMME